MHQASESSPLHGKAMIVALAIPVLVPAVIGGFQATRLLVYQDDLDPPVLPYQKAIDSLNESVGALERTVVDESTLLDWAAWNAVDHSPPQPAEADPAPSPVPKPDVHIEYKLELQGIVWHVGQPYAYINRKMAGLNEVVDGCTVTYIGRDSVVVVDPTGQEHRFNIDESLRKQYPSYQQP